MKPWKPRRVAVAVFLMASLVTGSVLVDGRRAAAQIATLEEIPVAIGESGQDYLGAVRGWGIQSDIRYLDERIKIEPPPPEPERGSGAAWLLDPSVLFWFLAAAFAAMLLFTVSMGARYGGLPTASLARRPQDRRRRKDGADGTDNRAGAAPDRAAGAFPNDFLRIADRRAALVLLLNRALERAAELNNMVLGRGETARGVLRALPARWTHLPALRRLVEEEELVRFGGRDIPESVFGECIEIARPLFGRGGRA